jgi:glutaredoxin 3
MTNKRIDFTGAIQVEEPECDVEQAQEAENPQSNNSTQPYGDSREVETILETGDAFIEGETTLETGDAKVKKVVMLAAKPRQWKSCPAPQTTLESGDTSIDGSRATSGASSGPKGKEVEENEKEKAMEIVITDLDVYEGETLGEKIDSLVQTHPVVMISRTWCLFSVDALNFLVMQMDVSVHSLEVDKHPQGKEILQYVYEKQHYKTTPIIFIRGDFLGGFEEVNALYAKGRLKKEYLRGLSHGLFSQADLCEAFIANTNYLMKPYFWFPEKVDGNVVRISGILTCFAAAISAILVHWERFFWARYVTYAIAIDFFLRLLGGAKFSVFGRVAMLLASPLEPNIRMGRPKQFATCCGIIFSWLGSLCYLVTFPGHDIAGSVYMGGLAGATFMEGFLDFCVGCVFFRIGIKLGIFKR